MHKKRIIIKANIPLALLLFFSLFFPLSFSFRGIVLHDKSYIIDAASRIAKGEIPYRDFFYVTTPLTPFFNALVYRIVEFHYLWSKVLIFVFNCVFVYLTYRTLKLFIPKTVALVISMTASVWFYSILAIPWYDSDAWFFIMSWIYFFIISRAFKEFGFKAKTPFIIGSKKTVDWYKKNQKEIC